MSIKVKTAFILAAGLGTRLLPLTKKTPKPLLPINGRPVMTYAMDHLLTLGVERFIVNTHHLANLYPLMFPEGKWKGVPIIFRYEPVLLETGGGIKNIEDLLINEEDLLVYNGDIITNLPLADLVIAHRKNQWLATLVLRTEGGPQSVTINANNEVISFRGDSTSGRRAFLFTGIYMLTRDYFSYLQKGIKRSVITYFEEVISQKPGSIGSVIIDKGYWYDIGSFAEYKRVKQLLENAKLE